MLNSKKIQDQDLIINASVCCKCWQRKKVDTKSDIWMEIFCIITQLFLQIFWNKEDQYKNHVFGWKDFVSDIPYHYSVIQNIL